MVDLNNRLTLKSLIDPASPAYREFTKIDPQSLLQVGAKECFSETSVFRI